MTHIRSVAHLFFALFAFAPVALHAQSATPDPRGPAAPREAAPRQRGVDGPTSPSPDAPAAVVSAGYRSIHFAVDYPTGLAFPFQVAADGDNLFVSDATGNTVRMLQVVAGGIALVRSFGASGTGAGQFNGPEQVAIVGNDVFVADFGNNRVQRFDRSTGTYVSQFGAPGSGAGQFANPSGLIYNRANGLLYISEIGNDRIQAFTTTGSYVGGFATPGAGNGQLNSTPRQRTRASPSFHHRPACSSSTGSRTSSPAAPTFRSLETGAALLSRPHRGIEGVEVP